MNDLTRALYEAHVAHELARYAEPAQDALFDTLTARLFAFFASATLDQAFTRTQVLGVIDRYVIELRISGGITELVGQLSQTIFSSDASAHTRLDELLSYESYRGFAEKVQSLDGAFRELVRLITHTRSFQPLVARTIVLAARSVLFERNSSEAQAPAGPLAELVRELRARLGQQLETQLGGYLERHADILANASEASLRALVAPDAARSLADELWDGVSGMRLSQLYSLLTPTDIEDFVVLGYETWLSYRHTPYFRVVCEQTVDAFFATYGGESVQAVLDDMGVNEAMVAHELRALVGPVLTLAAQSGFLEQQIRARLEPFYRSALAQGLLAGRPTSAAE